MARVAVTAAADRSSGLAAELVAVGLEPIGLPCVRVEPASERDLARARAAAEEADLLVLTSSRPLDVLWSNRPFPEIPVAAVGRATAAQVAERGGSVEVIGNGGSVRLTAQLARRVRGKRVAYPHALGVDPRCAIAIADVAQQLVAVPVYRFVSMPPPPGAVDGVTFTSSPAVEGWLLARGMEGIVVGVIGAATTAACRRAGRRPEVMLRRPSYAHLAQAMTRHFVLA